MNSIFIETMNQDVRTMIDFSNCKVNPYKYYGGHNGNKICIVYQGEDYMLKFPAINEKLPEHVYSNNCISEYITCHIMETLGLKVQKTLLGTYKKNGVEKIVVACKDFTEYGTVLKQFAELKNSQIETSHHGYGTELKEVILAIEEQPIYDGKELKEFFFQLFIADCLVGNLDRHNGNWGFLINEKEKKVDIAPIYDCASCLYPQLTDERIKEIMNTEEEMNARVFVFPTSAIKLNGSKLNYYDFISSLSNEDCNQALLKIVPRIHLEKINQIIDDTPVISQVRKDFYKKIIQLRYEEILKYSYDLLLQKSLN